VAGATHKHDNRTWHLSHGVFDCYLGHKELNNKLFATWDA